jgi:hypothetical protein
MSYFVTCTFDLKNASRSDYEHAYTDLDNIGLKRTILTTSGKRFVAPTTMTMGEFDGTDVGSVRDDVREQVRQAFTARGFSSDSFISVAGNWAWGEVKTRTS